MSGVDEVPEDVHVPCVEDGRDLDPRHRDQSCRFRRGSGSGEGRNRVVVGDSDGMDAGGQGVANELFRCGPSVGRRRVEVEIDHAERLRRPVAVRRRSRASSDRYSRTSRSK